MASATLTMACLLLIPTAGPADETYMKDRSLLIPIRIDEARRAAVHYVLLFVQNKDGTRWDQVGAIPPDKEGFPFTATEDGSYSFKVAVLGRDGQRDPVDIYKAPVGKKIVVDTVPPEIRIQSAERLGDDVVVRWDIVEEHLDLASLKLEYRTSDSLGGLWTPAVLTNPQSGQASFRVTGPPALSVRLQVKDLAGNVSRWKEAPVTGGGTTGITTSAGLPPVPRGTGLENPPLPPPVPPPVKDDGHGWAPTRSGGVTQASVSPTDSALVGPSSLPKESSPPSFGSTPQESAPGVPASPPKEPVVATTGTSPPGVMGTVPPIAGSNRAPLPPLQMTNKKQITLDYEVSKFGPSGISEVKLFVTRDEGKTWLPAGGEENIKIPLLSESKGTMSSLKRSLVVNLREDGVYGFYLVVRSGGGLGKPEPQSGELPQMRIEVDTKAPEAQLILPKADSTRRDVLILRWWARDNNLGPTPITLQWAERKAGSWETIGDAELQNCGQYAWKVPTNIPDRVFLRLIVRDMAGNVAIGETAEPILVDLNEPEVTSLRLSGTPR